MSPSGPRGAAPAGLGERLQVGGPIRPGSLYVKRPADRELPERLAEGKLCYVLAPRQIGKSSLLLRTGQLLSQQGLRCVLIDLNIMGSDPEAESWYYGLLDEILAQLQLSGDLPAFWRRHEQLSPVHRFVRFLEDELRQLCRDRVVLFFDEIDQVLSLRRVRADDFFAALRSLHAGHAGHAGRGGAERTAPPLTFCLTGVAAPEDLISDPSRTPFNTGTEIRLEDFTAAEARAFLPALAPALPPRGVGGADPGDGGEALLAAVLAWTDGHPALTQRLCEALLAARDGHAPPIAPGEEAARVQAAVVETFLRGDRIDMALSYARERFALDRDRAPTARLLYVYKQLLDGGQLPLLRGDPLQLELRLSGLAAERRDGEGRPFLRVRNRIFATVFDRAWVAEQELSQNRNPTFTHALQRWRDSGKDPGHVLRGAAFEEANAWARGRSDVTPEELEFLFEGLKAEAQAKEVERGRERAEEQAREEGRRRERAEEQAREEGRRRERAEERERAAQQRIRNQRALRVLLLVVSALFLLASWAFLLQRKFAGQAEREAQRALQQQRRAEELADEAQRARLQAEELNRRAQLSARINESYRLAYDKAEEACGMEKGACERGGEARQSAEVAQAARAARQAQREAEQQAFRLECDEIIARGDVTFAEREALSALPKSPRRALLLSQCALRLREQQGDKGSLGLLGGYKLVATCQERTSDFAGAAESYERALALCRARCTEPSEREALSALLARARVKARLAAGGPAEAGQAAPGRPPQAAPGRPPQPASSPAAEALAPRGEVEAACLQDGPQGRRTAAQFEISAEGAAQAGDLRSALAAARCAVQLRQREGSYTMAEARAHDLLGRVHEKRGDLGRALESYRRALAIKERRLGPDSPDLQLAREHLQRLSGGAPAPN